jgi:hypothetical protein
MGFISENKKEADCAIVAAYNALKCLKRKANYRKIENIAKKEFFYDSSWGLDNSYVFNFFNKIGVKPKFLRCGVEKAYKEIKNKKGALILYKHVMDEKWHIVFAENNKNVINIYNSHLDFGDIVLGFQEDVFKVLIWTIGEAS